MVKKKTKVKLIYYAHSKKIYNTIAEKRELEIIRKAYHTAIIANPSELFNSEPTWFEYMEKEFPKVNLVVFSDYQGYIGKGVHLEIETANELGIEVKYLNEKGKITKHFRLGKVRDNDWIYYSRVLKPKKVIKND